MLAQERQNKILSLLDHQGTVRTIDLAEEFKVTDETIRRDLQLLEETNQLTRIHGGASNPSGRPKLASFAERQTKEPEKKRRIAEAALPLITPGRTYAFDSSTTAFSLVARLPDLPYRIVTNAYAVLDHLVRLNKIDLISTGGRFHPKTQTFIGGESDAALRRYQIHTAFISCVGLDDQRGASEGFEQQAQYKEVLIEVAEEVVLLVDSSKLAQRSEYFFASLKAIDHIITDPEADPKVLQNLSDAGCRITIAGESTL
jgi:DeoR/GlpR family transcriptional regulator of sugar metabolism